MAMMLFAMLLLSLFLATASASPVYHPSARDFADFFYDAAPDVKYQTPWIKTHWPFLVMAIVLIVALLTMVIAGLYWRRCVHQRRLDNADMQGTAVPPGMVDLNRDLSKAVAVPVPVLERHDRRSVVSGIGARSGSTPTGEFFRPLGFSGKSDADADADDDSRTSSPEKFNAARDSWQASLLARTWNPTHDGLPYPAPRYEPR